LKGSNKPLITRIEASCHLPNGLDFNQIPYHI
jgi:hypothetical protein